MTLKIGNVELENNVILAPMAGVTDMPYRILCREQGSRSGVHGDGEREGDPLQE